MERQYREMRSNAAPLGKHGGRALCLTLIALIAAACVPAAKSDDPVTVSRFVTGTIVGVDASGSAICLRPDSGGEQLCGIPLQRPGAPRLTVGESIGIAVSSIATGKGNRIETFIVYSPPPQP